MGGDTVCQELGDLKGAKIKSSRAARGQWSNYLDLEQTCVIWVEGSLANVSSRERGADCVLLRHRGEGQGRLAPRRQSVLEMRWKEVQFGAVQQPTQGSVTLSLCSNSSSQLEG